MDKAVEILREKVWPPLEKGGPHRRRGMAYTTVVNSVGGSGRVNAETGFVGKNEKFVDFVKGVARRWQRQQSPPTWMPLMALSLRQRPHRAGGAREMVLVIGENIQIRRCFLYRWHLRAYVHAGSRRSAC